MSRAVEVTPPVCEFCGCFIEDRDHDDRDGDVTCAECSHSARYKWGSDGSREHAHADYETAPEWREKHPDANGNLVFIQRESDPFAFVDGDDVPIADFPDDATAAQAALTLVKRGNVTTETLRAFTLDEFRDIVQSMS